MKRVLPLVATAVLVVYGLVAATAAAAAEPRDVASELARNGYYVEDGAEVVDQAALSDALSDARESGQRLGVAFLADQPGQGGFGFAEDVLDSSPVDTVLVLTPDGVAAASTRHDDGVVQGALDRAADDFAAGGDAVAGVATFAEELGVRAGGGTAAVPDAGGGLGTFGLLLFVAAVVLLGAMTLVSSARQRRRLRTRGVADLATARTELRRQTQAVADGILAVSDKLSIADSPEADTEYGKATQAYQAVVGTAEKAPSLAALAEVADDLDRARWHLEAAQAAADGEERRRTAARSACFFDPVHGAGAEEATLRAAGREDLPVRVCTPCADALRAGAHPPEHRVTVGMRELPVVMAPRGFGGAELSWLGEFSLVPAGGEPLAFDWGRYGSRMPATMRPQSAGSGSTPTRSGYPRRRSGWGWGGPWGWGGGWGWGWGGGWGHRRGYGRHRGGWGGGWGGGSASRRGGIGGGSVSRGGGSVSRGGSRGGGSISRGGGSRRR